jgi:mycothiol synthase
MGEIYVVAVHPDFVGRGIGTALTAAGLNHMAEHGAQVAMLFVDEDNDAAVSSYERLGFARHHRERAFVGDVPSSLNT